jgi:hypothetical protein
MVAAMETSTFCPSARPVVLQGREHGDYSLQSGVDVRMAAGVAARLGQGLAEMLLDDRGQAGLRLNGRGKGRTIFPRCRLSVSAQRHVDHTRIEGSDILVAETEADERAGSEIFDYDVRLAAQPRDDLARLGIV